jgi:hypothetical protein
MSSNHRTLIETLTEHPGQYFSQFYPNLTSFYQSFCLYLSTEYFLFFTILISILTALIVLSLIRESKVLSHLPPLCNHPFSQSSSLLTDLLNSSHYLQGRFAQELLRALNQTLAYSKVRKSVVSDYSHQLFVLD